MGDRKCIKCGEVIPARPNFDPYVTITDCGCTFAGPVCDTCYVKTATKHLPQPGQTDQSPPVKVEVSGSITLRFVDGNRYPEIRNAQA